MNVGVHHHDLTALIVIIAIVHHQEVQDDHHAGGHVRQYADEDAATVLIVPVKRFIKSIDLIILKIFSYIFDFQFYFFYILYYAYNI